MNPETTSMVKTLLVVGALVGTYLISSLLFWIVFGVYAAVLVVRKNQPTEGEAEEPEKPEYYDRILHIREDALKKDDGVVLSEGPWVVFLMVEGAMHRSTPASIVGHTALCVPIPFCFTVRPNRSLLSTEKLVRNTPLPKAEFEYELKRVPLFSDSLNARLEASSNYPKLLTRLMSGGLSGALEDLLSQHRMLFQELSFDGSRLHLVFLPVADPQESPQGFEDGAEAIATLATLTLEFIASNSLVEAVAAKS